VERYLELVWKIAAPRKFGTASNPSIYRALLGIFSSAIEWLFPAGPISWVPTPLLLQDDAASVNPRIARIPVAFNKQFNCVCFFIYFFIGSVLFVLRSLMRPELSSIGNIIIKKAADCLRMDCDALGVFLLLGRLVRRNAFSRLPLPQPGSHLELAALMTVVSIDWLPKVLAQKGGF
jgi:hypothetical protein